MNFDGCIVTQTHIPELDVQSGLRVYDKIDLINDSIYHLRKYNPDSYIILCGHGNIYPDDIAISKCNAIIWETPCYKLSNDGFVDNMPAQYKSVFLGIRMAAEKGFKNILKTRTDCLHLIPNICQHSEKIIETECKQLLITQQTSPDCPKLGDCFMFGSTKILYHTWNRDKPILHNDGLQHIGLSFYNSIHNKEFDIDTWNKTLKDICAFRDVITLKYVDFRRNYYDISIADIDNNTVNLDNFYWGKKLGWHVWDTDGNMKSNLGNFYTEKTFYS